MKWKFGPLGWGPFRVGAKGRVHFGLPVGWGILTPDEKKKKVVTHRESEPLNLFPLEVAFLVAVMVTTLGLAIGIASVLLGL